MSATHRLLETDPGAPKREPTTAPERPDEGAQHPLRCRACARVITFASSRVEPDGRHVHMRLNPEAVAFIFGCFREAPGAVVVGEPTAEATWFSGCRWQYAHCAGCFTHLGWCFSGAATFFGLVLERLVGE